ncbi:MAG TPA: 5-oxoprolinase subunit PxpA [Flavihumibacter sp.]|jgi:UPF0271 protein
MDINCDLGEGKGVEAAILPYINSANIACGFHAGSPTEMVETVALAKQYGVNVGAHPSWDDRANFGRSPHQLPAREIESLVLYQLGALDAICRSQSWPMVHVKPHGALYNQAAADPVVATAIVRAIEMFNPTLHLFAPSDSELARQGKAAGLIVKEEAFADRRYTEEGQLVSRTHPDALITDIEEVLNQISSLIDNGEVQTISGNRIPLRADTICIHGDGITAVELTRAIHQLVNQKIKGTDE